MVVQGSTQAVTGVRTCTRTQRGAIRQHIVRTLRVNLTSAALLLAAFFATSALVGEGHVAYAEPAPKVVQAETNDAADSGTYEAVWTSEVADRFPSCREHREGDVAGSVVVILQTSDVRRVSTDAAYALNTDDERANNVWVVGVRGAVSKGVAR